MASKLFTFTFTCDNATLQQNRAVSINMPDSRHGVCWSLEIERRSLVAAMMKPTKPRETVVVQIRDQKLLRYIDVVEAEYIRAGVGERYTITLAASVERFHAPTVKSA